MILRGRPLLRLGLTDLPRSRVKVFAEGLFSNGFSKLVTFLSSLRAAE
jgi:hypothetical protein